MLRVCNLPIGFNNLIVLKSRLQKMHVFTDENFVNEISNILGVSIGFNSIDMR